MTNTSGLPANWENLSETDRRRLAPLWQRTVDVDALTARAGKAAIVGSRPALVALKNAIEQALASGDAEIPVTTVDGKPFRLAVRRIDAADAAGTKAARYGSRPGYAPPHGGAAGAPSALATRSNAAQ